MLHTGGTIGMGIPKPPHSDHPLSPDEGFVRHLKKQVPELWRLAQIEVLALSYKDSSQITPHDWVHIAKTVSTHSDDYDAFVITHGTDTMVYTGTALSYVLPFPCKPVVFTGSQRPLQEIRNDARRNLINSVAIAAGQRICEVTLFFDTVLLRANRAKKVHIEEYFTFDSPNFPRLAQEKLKTFFSRSPREHLSRPRLEMKFDTRIQIVKAFPGADVALQPKARAVVIEAFGCGNLPLFESSVLEFLKICAKKKIPVVMTSQVQAGALSPEIYEMGRQALDLGVISSVDMTFEATLVKCMMLAGNKVDYADWPAGILSNWSGEITPSEN
ncbi:MAG: asparaginase [Bdellovibrionota bacterium]